MSRASAPWDVADLDSMAPCILCSSKWRSHLLLPDYDDDVDVEESLVTTIPSVRSPRSGDVLDRVLRRIVRIEPEGREKHVDLLVDVLRRLLCFPSSTPRVRGQPKLREYDRSRDRRDLD